MVIGLEDEKKILNALLDDDESFIVKKRKKEEDRLESIVKQVRETIKKRSIEEDEERLAQLKRLERIKESLENVRIGVSEIEKTVVGASKEEKPRAVKFERVETEKPKFAEQPYLSDVEINVLKAIMRFGANVRRISRFTGYPEVVISKAIEKLIEKGYLDENLNVAEKALPIAGISTEEKSVGVRIIDVAIILTAIVLVLSILYYFGYI